MIDLYMTLTIRDFAMKIPNPAGIGSPEITQLEISPNPSSGIFRIKSGIELKGMKVFRSDGRQIETVHDSGSHCRIDLSSEPPGLYILHCESAGGIVARRLIKL
jgi:hypothetical protein